MIRVNGKEFDAAAVFATDGSMSMTFTTTDALSKIEGYFPESVTIEVVEGGEVTAKYYNKAVLSLKVTSGAERTVTVILRVSELQESAEDELNGRVDTSDGAIEELAIMAADHEERLLALEEQIAALIVANEAGSADTAAEEETTDTAASEEAETEAVNG